MKRIKKFSAESYEMRAAKRRKAKKVAQRRYEEERMAALEMEAAAAAGGSKAEDAAEHMSAIQVAQDEKNAIFFPKIYPRGEVCGV